MFDGYEKKIKEKNNKRTEQTDKSMLKFCEYNLHSPTKKSSINKAQR